MEVMGKSKVGAPGLINPSWHFLVIGRPMHYSFTREINFPSIIAMARLFVFMVHGIARLKTRRDILLLLFLLKTENLQASTKYLLMASQEGPK